MENPGRGRDKPVQATPSSAHGHSRIDPKVILAFIFLLEASTMIQRSSVSTIVATAEVAKSFRGQLRNDQLAALRRAFALPSTLTGFLLFVAGVLVVCAGLGVQV
ncbi:MAG: hypothetical protein KDD83_12825, partial [Caldilineaceae bacterium]|nr:hypothetical protein [Caldilineaceae bacterium]